MSKFEQLISPLIESQFPEFYKEEGPVFIEFCKAYFEWLEQNENAVGKSRDLFEIRDIDQTLEEYITHFKDKYLHLFKFETATDKRFIVKHAQDLYRSKGSERSIDLFFRLVFGTGADVYFPSTDIFRLSDNEWVKRQYIEVTHYEESSELIGQVIEGAKSKAIGFVEDYVRFPTDEKTVNVLFVTDVNGTFIPGEFVVKIGTKRTKTSPKVVGSADQLNVIVGGNNFRVGELVTYESDNGSGGIARVNTTTDVNRSVTFNIENGGWGYARSDIPIKFDAQTAVSNSTEFITMYDHTFLLDERVQYITYVHTPLTNLVNNEFYYVVFSNSSGIKIANSKVDSPINLTSTANSQPYHYIKTNVGANIYISNTVLFLSNVTIDEATLYDNFVPFDTLTEPVEYLPYIYLESVTQPLATISYNNANGTFENLDTVRVYYGNGTAAGVGTVLNVVESNTTSGNLVVRPVTGNLQINSVIYTTSNTIAANVTLFTDSTITGNIVGIASNVTVYGSNNNPSILYDRGSTVYVVNSSGFEIGNGIVNSASYSGTDVVLTLKNTVGTFTTGGSLLSKNNAAQSNITDVRFTIGVAGTNTDNFVSYPGNYIYAGTSNTQAVIEVVGEGEGADFSIANTDLQYTETIRLNIDMVSDYLTVNLDATAYGFNIYPTANLTTIALDDILEYDIANVGVITSLSGLGPGNNYSLAPFIYIKQKQVARKYLYDYKFDLTDATRPFTVGEQIVQGLPESQFSFNALSSVSNTNETIAFTNADQKFDWYEKVQYRVSTGNTAVYPLVSNNYYYCSHVNSTVVQLSETLGGPTMNLTSGSSESGHYLIKTGANGVVVFANNNTMFVKRTSLMKDFDPSIGNTTIVGQVSGAEANIVNMYFLTSLQMSGNNANVYGTVNSGNGQIETLTIMDSGFGYLSGEEVQLVSQEDHSKIATANVVLGGVGAALGYHRDRRSFLSSDKYLFDGDYYQEYSYVIKSAISLAKYSGVFKKTMHLAGTKFFGELVKSSYINPRKKILYSSVEQT